LTLDGIKVSFDPDDAIHDGLLAVSDMKTHPAFDGSKPTSNLHDVGVLILEKSQKKVTPAILAPQGFLDSLSRKQLNGAKFTVVGYGTTLDFPPPQFNSPDGKRRVAESQFQSLQATVIKLKQNKATGDGGTCSGDSGGPTFWRTPEGQEILVGITSFGDSVCVNLGAYYRADISETLNFIAAQ
jgi:secreted trypsin-like serine protease